MFMKKLLSLFTAVLFASSMMAGVSSMVFSSISHGTGNADDGAVWAITSDAEESSANKEKGLHFGTASSKEVQYVQLETSSIAGNITKVVVNAIDETESATMTVKVGETSFTGDKSSVSATQSDYTFTGKASGTIVVRIDRGAPAYKAIYVKSVIVTYDDGVPAINAEKIDLKTIIVSAFPYEKDTALEVTATSLSEDIVATVDGANVTVSGSPLAKEGGKLNVKISATTEVSFSDTIILTSGSTVAKVAVEAAIVKPSGDGTRNNPFTVQDVIKMNNGIDAERYWVLGYIAGCAGNGGKLKEGDPDSTSIAIGAAADQTEGLVPVQLSKTSKAAEKVRDDLNVHGTPSNIGKLVRVCGKLESYKGFTGVTSVNDYAWDAEDPVELSNDASIKSLKINGAAIAAKKNVYEYAVAADENIAEVEVVYELNHAGAKADKASPFKMAVPASSEDAATELKLTVTAEDNTTTAEYTIKVSRAKAAPKSSDATIQELKINNQVVTENNGNFAYVVPANENIAEVEVAFILNEVHAQADKENPFKLTVPASAEDPASVAKINVTAQDGVTKKEYTVSVTRAAAQGLHDVNADNNATKRIENGVLIIEKAGVRFNAFGQRIQ
jgi:hypothetical protein